jgi:hypothetical protein
VEWSLEDSQVSLQNTYFHLNVDCARKKNPQFEFRDILIHNEIKQNLSPEHKLKSDTKLLNVAVF